MNKSVSRYVENFMNNLFKDKNQTTYYGTLIVWDRFVNIITLVHVVRNKKHV